MQRQQRCDLPKELWRMIGKFLDSRIDLIRFRSVCSLWRSLVPLPDPTSTPPLPLRYPNTSAAEAALFRHTVYRMESLEDSRAWLVKFEESDSGEMRILHPVTNWSLRYFVNPPTIKLLSLLDFKVVELFRFYTLKFAHTRIDVPYVNKLVVVPNVPFNLGDEFAVFMIYKGGCLGYMRFGDQLWTRVDEQNAHYDDLIVYNGQCYVVDKWGTISWVNSALQLIQYSPPLCGFGQHKHLVESCGDLYVVDRYLSSEALSSQPEKVINYFYCDGEAIDFKVYRLDQEWGRWVDVKDLGDRVFILSYDGCFSVSTRDFPGVKGNCIFFTEQDFGSLPLALGRVRSRHCRVLDLDEGSMSNIGDSQMFWTPPSWLTP